MSKEERRSARSNVILTAMIEHGNARIPVRVSNLSEHGALVIGDSLPTGETKVTFRCNGVAIEGWVAWWEKGRAGIEFGNSTEPEALLQRTAFHHIEIIKDTREREFRRPGFRGNLLTDEEREIVNKHNRAQSEDDASSSAI